MSIDTLPVSVVLERYPSTRVILSLLSFLQSHSSVDIWTETLLGAGVLGPAKGLSSEGLELSTSGTCDQPIKDRIPLIVSRYVCSSEVGKSCSVNSCLSDNSPSSTNSSTGGLSDKTLSAANSKLEMLSLLEAFCSAGDPEPVVEAGLGRSERGGLGERCANILSSWSVRFSVRLASRLVGYKHSSVWTSAPC